jgi:Flp pilus assembly pilin Flp
MSEGVSAGVCSLRKLLIRNMQLTAARAGSDRSAPVQDCLLPGHTEVNMRSSLYELWREEQGQDIAEYAVMLAVILVIVVGTIRLIGGNANNVFSAVASSVGQ